MPKFGKRKADSSPEDAAAWEPVAAASAGDQEDADLNFQREILERLRLLEQQSSDYHRRSARREGVIDRLNAENEELRDNARRSVFEPVAADLIRLYDSLGSESERLTRAGVDPAITKLMMSFTQDIELILDRCGFEPFGAMAGDPFVVGDHAVAAVADTEDESLSNTVARVVSAGLRDRKSGQVRRPLKAEVYRFTGPLEPGLPGPSTEVDPTTPGSGEQGVPGSDLGE